MSMAVVIGLGVITWILVATFVALVVAGIIKLRNRQRPRRAIPAVTRAGSDDGAEWLCTPSRSDAPERSYACEPSSSCRIGASGPPAGELH